MAEVNKEAILKGVRLNVHLLSADPDAYANVVLAPNHVERVGDGEHVGAALEGSKSTISQCPVSSHQGGTQSATDAILSGLGDDASRRVRAFAVDVCIDDAETG